MPRSNPVQVIAKTGAILDQLADEAGLSVADIADRVDEPRPSVHRLLASLQQLGFVEASGRGRYRLGFELVRLGARAVDHLHLRGPARPALERLRAETEETVVLCVQRGFWAVGLDCLEGRWTQVSAPLGRGGRLPLHVGAAPLALLAFGDDAALDAYLRDGPLTTYTGRTATEPEQIRARCAKAKAEGHTVSDGDVIDGIAGVGAPVRDDTGGVCASISVSGPSPSLVGDRLTRTADCVMVCAAEISAVLGFVASHR